MRTTGQSRLFFLFLLFGVIDRDGTSLELRARELRNRLFGPGGNDIDERILVEHADAADLAGRELELLGEQLGEVTRVYAPVTPDAHEELGELPFMAAEVLLMEAVKRGGDRQDLHERFRLAALEAGRRIKQEGRPNELLGLLAADPAWAMTEAELVALLDPVRFTGCAGDQVRRFLAGEVAAALDGHRPGEAAAVRV